MTSKTKEFKLTELTIFNNELIHFFNINPYNSSIYISLEVDGKKMKLNYSEKINLGDIIPRIETSSGIRYRVLCNKGFFGCHGIERTICQIGATCRREDLTGDLCMSLFGKDYLNIRKLAGIKNEIPEEYKNNSSNRNNISNIINE